MFGGIGLLTSIFFIVVSVAEDWIMRLFTIPAFIMCASIATLLIVEIWS